MSHEKGHHPGATWRKCDFQCHTPRDRNWIGSQNLGGGTPELENGRQAWADAFVQAANSKDIGVFAITDHHDMCFISYVRKAADAAGLAFFPGMEVTCSDNAQCLVIFDPSCDEAHFSKLFGKLKGVTKSDHDCGKAAPLTIANTRLDDLVREISQEPVLREHCLVLPHFGNSTAHKSINQVGYHSRFAQLGVLGVYIECSIQELEAGVLDKVHGLVADWGTRRRALLATGDNRSESWDRLGAHECWIKLGEATIEAVRQAFLADEARIRYSPPAIPTERIVKMIVKSTLTGPDPLQIVFNDGLTALIGGRGSGKTSILEYLRFGLARSNRDLQQHEKGIRRAREETLLNETLAGGFVEVELYRSGVTETWKRTGDTPDHIVSTDLHGNIQNLTIVEAQRRFRARAFAQKGLSSTTADLELEGGQTIAADQLTSIAAAEELDSRREVDQHISASKRSVRTALQQLAAHWQSRLEKRQASSRVTDIKKKIDALGIRLAHEGVSSEDIDLMKEAPRYTRARSFFNEVENEIKRARVMLAEASSDIVPVNIDSYGEGGIFEEMSALGAAIVEKRLEIGAMLEPIMEKLRALDEIREEKLALFDLREGEYKRAHDKAAARQHAQRALVEESALLSRALEEAENKEKELEKAESKSMVAASAFDGTRFNLNGLLETRRKILTDAASKVAGTSSQMLRARLKRDPCPREYVESLASLCQSSYVSDAETKCEAWVKRIVSSSLQPWEKVCDEIKTIFSKKIESGNAEEPTHEIQGLIKNCMFHGGDFSLSSNMVRRIYSNFTDEAVGAILAAVPRDYIVLSYVEDGHVISFEKASPGQQASALLELLLSQQAGTLIIDQPEDDIDNRIIMRVVKLVRDSKHRRQLIFATHNANIVVNGDADKVIALTSGDDPAARRSDGRTIGISSDGAIETKKVREDITHVMEGGKAAFDLRSRKYNFDRLV